MPAEMGTEPEYLVLVPYYSNLGYLAETLRSVAAQRDGSWRCVVVDDSPGGDSVARLVDSLGLRDITLVVHDFGGPIGLAYALERPDNVRRLVLFNTWMWSFADDRRFRRHA